MARPFRNYASQVGLWPMDRCDRVHEPKINCSTEPDLENRTNLVGTRSTPYFEGISGLGRSFVHRLSVVRNPSAIASRALRTITANSCELLFCTYCHPLSA